MMPERFLYLAIDAGVLLLPLLFSFHPRIRFHRHWLAFANACVMTMIPFIVWDIAFTGAGYWGFNPRYLTGINMIGLPMEEWLFFICIPFACVFTFYCFGMINWKANNKFWNIVFLILSVVLLVNAFANLDRAYTFLTFLLTGLVLGFLSVVEKPVWLPRAIFTYILIFPFFFLSNGLLTGSWIPEEVVWYNDAENLGIRFGTIPIEDSVYGFLLVLLNITLFERQNRLAVNG